ncbi:MAG: phosphatase PAP2 family protein [Synechococcales cyanobacterium C42_A2020_086]|jgi:undecaprenyl-diphosphatase|nr:phosphatase PAP2 family protein [Synechococcales cyanobacterium C42_A2020_086]
MSLVYLWKHLQSFIVFLGQWWRWHWKPLLFLFGTYVPLAIFAILALQIWQLEGGLAWDIAIMQAIHAAAQPTLDQIVPIVTKFGTQWGVIPVSLAISVGFLYGRRWRFLLYWLLTVAGCRLINWGAKLWLHRARPNLWEHPPVPEFSFPSGHAMLSMGFVMALIVLTWNTRWRGWVAGLGSLFVVTIGWTRLYLGVHYPSDIVAGWMLSIAWVTGVSLVVNPLASAPQTPSHQQIKEEKLVD